MRAVHEKPIIAITMGEAAGIGPEILVKSLEKNSIFAACRPLIIGDYKILRRAKEAFRTQRDLRVIRKAAEAVWGSGKVNVIDLDNIPMESFAIGRPNAVTGKAMVEYTELSVKLYTEGEIKGIVGGPHSKKAANDAGIFFDGYPGFVGRLTGSKYPFMMLVAGKLRVTNVTLHLSLRKALALIKTDLILEAIKATRAALRTFGVEDPRIAVAALNPHAGEEGLFGDEDEKEIRPAVLGAQQLGIRAVGPLPADTLFCNWREGTYDAYVAMYHDQAHIPVKVVAFKKGCAVPIGVPVNFATVDHGCALDIAWKGIADPTVIIEAIRLVSGRVRQWPG